jgi:preprotein translocase subunit SecF
VVTGGIRLLGRNIPLVILLALLALLLLGPEVNFGLTIAIFIGIFVGTYSSIYISSPVLVWLGVKPDSFLRVEDSAGPKAQEI